MKKDAGPILRDRAGVSQMKGLLQRQGRRPPRRVSGGMVSLVRGEIAATRPHDKSRSDDFFPEVAHKF